MAQQTFNNTKINVEFDEDYQSRTNINSGENISSLFAKIRRFILDLKAVCFSGSYNDLSDVPDVVTKEYVDPIKSQAAINRTTLGVQRKNLLKNNAVTKTVSGITFTVNDDKSITVNGTNSTSNYVNLIVFQGELETGTYILSGAVSDVFRIRLGLGTTDVYGSYVGVDRGNGYTFIVTEKAIYTVTCQIASGKTASNVIFKPMLRYADIIDDTYEPYQPSVQEQIPYSLSVSSKSTSAAISYNGVPTLICFTPSESVSSGGGMYLINSVGTAVYLIDKTGIVINTDTTNKTFTITNNTASTYDVYISCAYKKE